VEERQRRRKGKLQKNEKPTERATDKNNKEYLEEVCDEIMEFKEQDVTI